jgi:valyl-tRNA synthetase
MITLYPRPDARFVDDGTDQAMALVQRVITTIRSLRTERGLGSAVRSQVVLTVADDYKKTILEGYKGLVGEQGRCREVTVRRTGEAVEGPTAVAMAGDVEVTLILEAAGGDVEVKAAADKERRKLNDDRAKLVKDRDFYAKKLSNPAFVERAKPEIIEKDRAKVAEVEAALARLDEAIGRLGPSTAA